MPRFALALLGLAGLVAIPATAPAQQDAQITANDEPAIVIVRALRPSRDRLSRSVYIGDLDLKSPTGKAAMEDRVGKAIEDMCAIPSPLPGYADKMTKPCRDEAMDSARPQMAQALAAAAE